MYHNVSFANISALSRTAVFPLHRATLAGIELITEEMTVLEEMILELGK
jgi:hypothetical protein